MPATLGLRKSTHCDRRVNASGCLCAWVRKKFTTD